jgi:hypothetical protein
MKGGRRQTKRRKEKDEGRKGKEEGRKETDYEIEGKRGREEGERWREQGRKGKVKGVAWVKRGWIQLPGCRPPIVPSPELPGRSAQRQVRKGQSAAVFEAEKP